MAKELFNQNLINDPVTPDDNDRVGLGQPSVSGGKNIAWSYLKRLLSWTDKITISDPTTQTVSGTAQYLGLALSEYQIAIYSLRQALRQIAGAIANIEADPKPQLITDAETQFTFIESIPSSNTNVIEVDGLNDQVIIKQAGIYQFITFLNVSNNDNQLRNLTLRTRDNSDDEIITERTLPIPSDGYAASSSIVFEVQEADIPLTLDFYLQADDPNAIVVNDLRTTIITGAQVNTGGGLASIAEPTNNAIRSITGYSDGNDVFNYNIGSLYEYDSAETELDDDDNYLTPNDITEPDPGRWIKRTVFSVEGHTHDYDLVTITPSANQLALLFDDDKMSNDYTITDALEITKAAGTHKPGKIIQLIMIADGNPANKPTFSTDYSLRSDNWDNTNGIKNVITMKYLNITSKIIIDFAKL